MRIEYEYEHDPEYWGSYTCQCGINYMRERHLIEGAASARSAKYHGKCNQCHNRGLLDHPVGSGWMPLIIELNERLTELCPDYRIAQIKEKFGGLRYYVDSMIPEGWKLIDEAEAKSYTICETCGDPGTLNPGGHHWAKTACGKHA